MDNNSKHQLDPLGLPHSPVEKTGDLGHRNDSKLYLTIENVNDEYVAIVQQDEGKDKMIVEFNEGKIKTKIYLNDFMQALDEARTLLLQ